MTSPRRRPIELVDFVAGIADRLAKVAAEIDAGYASLRDELRHAGWPGRTPEGDRKPGAGERPPIDYADPTGDGADRYASLLADLETMQDHRHVVETSLAALIAFAARHRPDGATAEPACTVSQCDQPVESRRLPDGRKVYIGMSNVAGTWYARPGRRPTCARHRRHRGAA